MTHRDDADRLLAVLMRRFALRRPLPVDGYPERPHLMHVMVALPPGAAIDAVGARVEAAVALRASRDAVRGVNVVPHPLRAGVFTVVVMLDGDRLSSDRTAG